MHDRGPGNERDKVKEKNAGQGSSIALLSMLSTRLKCQGQSRLISRLKARAVVEEEVTPS
jgi:hypothetical protein